MKEHLQVLVSAYSVSEFLLAQHRYHVIQINIHTKAVQKRAIAVAEATSELLEQCGYKPFLYTNDYVDNQLVSTPLSSQPLFKRGDAYFLTVHGGGIIFALGGDLTSGQRIEANGEMLNFQSGRFEDDESFKFFLEELNPALEALSSHLDK